MRKEQEKRKEKNREENAASVTVHAETRQGGRESSSQNRSTFQTQLLTNNAPGHDRGAQGIFHHRRASNRHASIHAVYTVYTTQYAIFAIFVVCAVFAIFVVFAVFAVCVIFAIRVNATAPGAWSCPLLLRPLPLLAPPPRLRAVAPPHRRILLPYEIIELCILRVSVVAGWGWKVWVRGIAKVGGKGNTSQKCRKWM